AIWFISKILIGPLKKLTNAITQVQSGDLRVKLESNRSDEIGMLSRNFQMMVNDLSGMIRSIQDNATQLKQASQQLATTTEQNEQSAGHIASAIQEVAAGAHVQMKQVQETSKSMAEVNAAILRITESSSVATDASQLAMGEAHQGNERVDLA